MDYNFFVPNIYGDSVKNKDNNQYKIIEKTIILVANIKYDLYNMFNFNQNNGITALYFKTNSSFIYLYTQNLDTNLDNNKILIYNNFLFIDAYNECYYNRGYSLCSNEVDSELTIYIIEYIIYIPIKTYATVLYDKKINNKNNMTSFCNNEVVPFCTCPCPLLKIIRITIQLHFLTKKNDFNINNKTIKFISNNIIFYYSVNKIKKINKTQYLYTLNLIKLEDTKNNSIIIDIKYNIIDINNIDIYFNMCEKNYNKICYFLFEQHDNQSYNIDFNNFIIKYEIDKLWYMNLMM
jgi:hypothetical protein